LDELIYRGFDFGGVLQFFGPAGSGKSQILFSIATAEAARSKRVLFFDSQGKFRPERLLEIANERGLGDPLPLVDVVRSEDPQTLLEWTVRGCSEGVYSLICYDDLSEPFLRGGYRRRDTALLSVLSRKVSVWALLQGHRVFVSQRVRYDPALKKEMPLGWEFTCPYIAKSLRLRRTGASFHATDVERGLRAVFTISGGGVSD
jgi:RecA/RadA recombinase